MKSKYVIMRKKFCIFHEDRVEKHYAHAREKHPHFCDLIKSDEMPFDFVKWHLENRREQLVHAKAAGVVRWEKLLECEEYEAMAEIQRGDIVAAVEELYDCIAVLLRTIDVLEGRQALGKPDTISCNDAGE